MRNVLLAAIAASALSIGSASAANLVTNGGFETGNAGFNSAYTFVPAPTPCCTGGLYDPATYAIAGNFPFSPVNAYHGSFGGAPQAGNAFMAVNGSQAAGAIVWENTALIPVTANTNYFFSTWLSSVNPLSPAVLSFSINGSTVGGTISPSATVGLWSQFFTVWNSGAATTADIQIENQNLAFGGNDFGLDSIAFSTMSPVPVPGALALFGAGLLGLGAAMRRRR